MRVARAHVCRMLRIKNQDELIFTSCGSESDNRAIDIALNHFTTQFALLTTTTPPHVVTSAIEHPAILVYLQALEEKGQISLTVLDVDEEGYVCPQSVGKALNDSTALVTIMHSNNEVGTVQPIREISRIIADYNKTSRNKKRRILLHSDGAQSAGKLRLDVVELGVDMFTVVGHKFGAPKGVAALYVKEGIKHSPLLTGGGQELGRRAGTENVILIVGMGEAAKLALQVYHRQTT